MIRTGLGNGSLVWLAVSALAAPLMGATYFAGQHGFQNYLSDGEQGAVQAASLAPRGAWRPRSEAEPQPALLREVDHLFTRSRKGPRADHRISNAGSTVVRRKPRRAVAAISPYQSRFSSAPPKGAGGMHSVNRSVKSDRLIIPVTHVARLLPAEAGENKEDGIAGRYDETFVKKISTAVFLELPSMERNNSFIALTEVDRSNVRMAALRDETPRSSAGPGRPARPNPRYYGALMAAETRAREKNCLAKAIYFEARGEPVHGQLAVAQVVMNRVRESYYPDTVCDVVFEGAERRNKCQFSFACDGRKDVPRSRRHWRLAKNLAKKVMDGDVWLTDIGYASHYHATYVRPRWIKYMRRIKRIGVHVFYRGTFLPKSVASADGSV